MKLPISKLVNNTGQIEGLPANPRTINKDDYQKLLKSLQDDPGFLNHKPLHVYEHNGKYIVLGGNQRLKALRGLGHKDVPVTVYDPETPVEVLKRRVIVDNSTFGDYDMDMLGNEWDDEPLDDWGVDLPDDWLQDEPEIEEDEAPEVSDEPPVSKLGEVYQLGRHRVMCGDSSDYSLILELLNGDEADALITDPPYGIGIDGQKLSNNNANPKHNRKAHDFRGWDNERPGAEHFTIMLQLGLNTVIWGGNYFADLLPATRGWIYWNKGQDGLTMSDGELAWTTMDKPLRAVTCNRANLGETVHPTQKPLQVITFSMDYVDAKTVLDLFLGSGSTLIACEQTDRTCFGMELDPKYVDVIRKRYHKFVTGSEEGWADATSAIVGN